MLLHYLVQQYLSRILCCSAVLLPIHLGDTFNLYQVYSDRILVFQVALGGAQQLVGSIDLSERPNLIELASAEAVPGSGLVALRWQTASETDNAGFYLYRHRNDGTAVRINAELIPARGNNGRGAAYEYVDRGLTNRQAVTYILESVDLSGSISRHGPYTAVPRLIYEGRGLTK